MEMEPPKRRWTIPGPGPAGSSLVRTCVILVAVVAPLGVSTSPISAQITVPEITSTHSASLTARIKREVDEAVLSEDDDQRDAHLAAAEQLARSLVAQEPESADAHYWLGVVLGIRTENTGGLGKLNLGREVFEISARVVELDSLHAGGHELMGRVHANIQRLNWLARKMALSGGMGDTVGASSWEAAIGYFQRACELDAHALGPRMELGRIYLERGREEEGRELLEWVVAREPASEVEQRTREEAEALLRGHALP